MTRRGDGTGSEREGSTVGIVTEALEMQRQMCDEAMSLVNAGVALQNASPPNVTEAERKLTRAVDIMEQAMNIRYRSAEEKDAADRLNNKMMRYVKMIKSQRAKSAGGAGHAKPRSLNKHNILEMERLPEVYAPVLQLLNNSTSVGDICETLKRTFGFQDSSVLNQKEHLLLLLTNFKEQTGQDDGTKKNNKKKNDTETIDDYLRQRDPQLELDLASKGIARLHGRVFANYKKWCKYVSQKPKFSSDPLVDIALFFLIWGEAANFRQMPECLCFLLHTMLPKVNNGGHEEPGTFLANTIRPMYIELRRDSDKKTSKGARAPHRDIRNYDDFNEFFWTKKCLKYDYTNIGEAFANYDKKGRPKIVKKTYNETRSWMRAILSFRRIFFMNCALFLATLGFSIDMVLFCPTSPIMYGKDVQPLISTQPLEILGKKYAALTDSSSVQNTDDTLSDNIDSSEPQCLYSKLATCLGVNFYTSASDTFGTLPQDFKELLQIVPFTDCVEKTVGRCQCYHDLIDNCFKGTGNSDQVSTADSTMTSVQYDQSLCAPTWLQQVNTILDSEGDGLLNCGSCQVDITSLMKQPTRIVKLLTGLINFSRPDKGVMALLGGAAMIGLVCVCELQNRFFSGIGMGFVGRSMPVAMNAYCRYTCFWIVLYLCKLMFDYQFIVKTLVETTLFVYSANSTDYLKYSHFMLQFTQHNIIYIMFLWIPAWMVFLYDAQIFYSVLSVIYGSFAGFNLRIGELRSFRILRLTFKSIPGVFNRKLVPNIVEEKSQKVKNKNKKNRNERDEMAMPLRRFERISMSQGAKPLTVKTQKYSSLLEQRDEEDVYNEMKTPNGTDEDMSSQSSRTSNIGSITGVSGAEFERTIPFAMAWNRCLTSLREADVISDRELNVLSYLIDSKETVGRRLYPPAFLTAGKLDESIDIVLECSALYEKLRTDKKKKEKTLQKIETTMRERLTKDDLRVESILGSYKFSSQVLRILLGEEHKELDDCYNFIEEMASNQQILKGLKLDNLYLCRAAAAELMKSILEVPKKSTESSIKFQRALYKVIDSVESMINCLKMVLAKQENLVQMLNDTPLKPNSFFFPGDSQRYASVQLQKIVNDEAALDIVSRAYQLLTVDNFDAEPRSEEGRRRLRFFANSLFMDMPEAKPIRKIRSLTVSTPYYNEIVMYSIKDLTAQNDDCVKLLYYLQTIYPFEWENLLERIQAKDMNEALKKSPEEQLALFEAKLSSGAGEAVISRDAMRMASRLDFFRLHSWFYGNLGWYFTQSMTVVGVYFFIYGKVYMALSGMDSYFLEKGGMGIAGTLNTSWAFQFGFLLVSCVLPTNQNYGVMSYSLWIIAATWMWAPFFFNPSGLDWDKVIEDYNDWQNWLKTTNDSADSWFGWWSNEQEYLEHTTRGARFITGVRKLRFLLVAIGMYLNMMYNAYFEQPNRIITSKDSLLTYALSGLVIVMFALLICCGYIASRVTKKMSMKQRKLRKIKFVLSCCCFLFSMMSLTVLSVGNLFALFILLMLAVYWFMQMCILRLQYHHIVVRALARAYDRAVGWIVFGPIMVVSMFLPFISSFQQRVMFNNAFTSGLEVSKLFAHDVAPTQVVKVKRVSKKKKNRDD
ncbi:hypothetical protein PsorP6_004256 [Peronosclerospora sorghi]|uniref:Uncharacterized protein n=1 Tax=Peronosclerospora sorghi TaxID=230839 RepID=A0ACC0VRZ8_9STRA|nr:hypothetical protein PsorP6_004256 [Peronosclerospora sorghi]